MSSIDAREHAGGPVPELAGFLHVPVLTLTLTPEIHTQLTRGPRRVLMSAADAGARKDHPQSQRTLR
jgi:hypothetical protein